MGVAKTARGGEGEKKQRGERHRGMKGEGACASATHTRDSGGRVQAECAPVERAAVAWLGSRGVIKESGRRRRQSERQGGIGQGRREVTRGGIEIQQRAQRSSRVESNDKRGDGLQEQAHGRRRQMEKRRG